MYLYISRQSGTRCVRDQKITNKKKILPLQYISSLRSSKLLHKKNNVG